MAHLADQINHLYIVLVNRYRAETVIIGIDVPDPYSLVLEAWHWQDGMAIDDVSKWPSVDYGCIYTKFINIPSMYTAEALKSFRSHDSYAPYLAVYVTADILNIP